jgi:hypothetical protein
VVNSFKETTRAKARSRWGTVVPEPGLEAYVTSWWRLLVSIPSVLVVNSLVVLLSILLDESLGMPYEAVVGLSMVLIIVATSSWFVLYLEVKRSAGRALGVSPRDSRKLDISSPEALSASVRRIRGGQHPKTAADHEPVAAGSSGMVTSAGGRVGVARSSNMARQTQGASARTLFSRAYLVIALGLVIYTASLGWQPFLAVSAAFALVGIPLGLVVARARRVRGRRLRVIAAQLPGWHLYGATPGLAELATLCTADFQPATNEALTIAYGPGGIQVWAGFHPPHPVCTLPWREVAEVCAGEVRTGANTNRPGLVVILKDGTQHEFQLTRRPDFSVRPITHADLATLVEEIQASRLPTESAKSEP